MKKVTFAILVLLTIGAAIAAYRATQTVNSNPSSWTFTPAVVSRP